jgi:hypothetical protein
MDLVTAQKPHLKWQVWDWGSKCPWDEQLKADFNTIFASIDTVLLSRKMRERALVAGGDLIISGAAGKGTIVRVRIPSA